MLPVLWCRGEGGYRVDIELCVRQVFVLLQVAVSNLGLVFRVFVTELLKALQILLSMQQP